MANCAGCGNNRCSCIVTGGNGATVTGDGSADNPYIIDVTTSGLPACPVDPGVPYVLTCTDGVLSWELSPSTCVVI